MKILVLVSFLYGFILANPLQELAHTFSNSEKVSLLEELKHSSSNLHTSKSYKLKSGWNSLSTPKDGVDVLETFENILNITHVVTYDEFCK